MTLCLSVLASVGRRGVVSAFTSTTTATAAASRAARYSTSLFAEAGSGSGGGRVSAAQLDQDILKKTDAASNGSSTQKQERLDTNPPKGTRDFYPPDMRLRSWLFDQWRTVAAQYAFQEYDAPVLESSALYTRKAGEEVTQQLYAFTDKGDRPVALRPEMTPSLARMVMAKGGSKGLPMPLKWYSIPQCWRYERMTRGRRREHYQWNMDVWGVDGVEAEAELLSAMVTFFRGVGLTAADVGVKINSRLVIGEVLTELGIPEEKFAATCVLVDKLEKLPLDAVQSDLEELGLSRGVVEKLTSVLTNNSVDDIAKVLGDDSEAVRQLTELFALCESYGISDWLLFDASVVRGLAYYTGVVFEAFDRRGELRAIAGGGAVRQIAGNLWRRADPRGGIRLRRCRHRRAAQGAQHPAQLRFHRGRYRRVRHAEGAVSRRRPGGADAPECRTERRRRSGGSQAQVVLQACRSDRREPLLHRGAAGVRERRGQHQGFGQR